jgi:hypothetical protein
LAVPNSAFDVKTPSGTLVVDKSIGSYILFENGRKREILPGEYNGTNIEEIRRINTGDLLPGR